MKEIENFFLILRNKEFFRKIYGILESKSIFDLKKFDLKKNLI